jgi:ribonucleoside-diphosphate reductase alpha chain
MGHIKMMAATQPFLSGAISKTVNLPQDCSVDDIAEAYVEAWRQGIKAVAIYRDNSKGTQPLNVTAQTDADKKGTKAVASAVAAPAVAEGSASVGSTPGISPEAAQALAAAAAASATAAAQQQIAALEAQMRSLTEASTQNADALDAQAPPRAVRHRLPAERASVTHKFGLGGHEGYITVGLYPNGSPGEIFIRMAKEGSTVSGLMDSFATAISISLQHGVPLKVLCEKFAHTRFEPSGWTGNPEIGYAKSIMDYIFRWIQMRFLSGTQLDLFAGLTPHASVPVEGTVTAPGNTVSLGSGDEGFHSASGVETGVAERKGEASSTEGVEASAPRALQHNNIPSALASLAAADVTPQAILQREARAHGGAGAPGQASISDQDIFDNGTSKNGSSYDRLRALSDAAGRSSVVENREAGGDSFQDRGYHVADRLKEMYEMGDSPSCATCGAIMTRSGSCYRCMSCGSTSGCS